MADERIKAKLKPPVWYAQRGEVVALSPSEEDILAARQGIGQETEMSYRPKIAGGYTFYVDVFGEGVGGPAAQSSQKVAVRCKILQREGAWANELCRLDNAYTDPPLSVIVMTDRSNATSGERINVNAVGQGGKTPYQFTWTGSVEGQGKSIIFVPSQSNRSLSVEIKDARGQTAKESITFTVDRPLIPMEGLKDKALFGTWLNARAIAGENKSILWRSSPTVTMKPQESGEGRTSILFDRMGKVKVWAEARIKKGDVYETVAETEQVEVTVLPPDGRIEVDPLIQAVGGAVTAEVKLAQTPEYGTVKYVWIDPPQPKREQISDAKIKFILGDASPVPIEVELRGSRGNETIVNLKRPYDPEGKPTATEVAVGNESTGSTKKKGGAAKLIKAKEMVSTGKLTEGIALAEEAGAIDPSSTEAFAYAAKIKSEQALITDKLKNFIVFADQENFAEAEKILGEIKKLHPLYQPVIEADAILKTKKAAYEKKIKDSDEKLAQAKLDVRKGKLNEGIEEAYEAAKINKNNKEAVLYAQRYEKERQDILSQLDIIKTLINESKFNDARQQITFTKNINPNYQPILDVENLLNAENLKYNELAQRKLNGVSTAIDRKEFKKSLDLARDIRTSMKLYGLDEENLKRWENWAQTHEAEKEGNRKKLKKAEEQLGNYDYENALKSFDEGFRNFNNLWAVSDPEPPHYSKLREEAFTKKQTPCRTYLCAELCCRAKSCPACSCP
jgi:hypothetical protein